jgi:hypothetical protein
VLLAGVAFGAYTFATGSSAPNKAFVRRRLSPAAATACSAPATPTVSTPTGLRSARAVGHVLWISAPYYGAGFPTNSFLGANKSAGLSRVVLRGWRCSDGRLLRFWFLTHEKRDFTGGPAQVARREEPFAHVPVSSVALASTGTFTLTVRLRALLDGVACGSAGANCFLGGYLMFSSPGKWVVQAQHGSKIVGTAVFNLRG